MPFTGKATFSAGPDLPELAEDVADIIGIVSPYETPLLDHLGDPQRAAASTVHEWIEDSLLPNTDVVDQSNFTPDPSNATEITVLNGSRFRVGDQVRPGNGTEVMFVTGISGDTLTVVRGYGATTRTPLSNGMVLTILGNAALEGDDAPVARFTTRARKQNYTQIFTARVSVSGSMQAARQHGISDEVDYQKQERLRELLRDLENTIINGVAAGTSPQGSSTVRRTINGIIHQIQSNIFEPGTGSMPPGTGIGEDELTEEILNTALRLVWENASSRIDTIVVNGMQKRQINAFASSSRSYAPDDSRYRDLISIYESDFGICRVVLSRWVPPGTVLLLDSSRVEVMPLRGRSFHYRPLAATGDAIDGQLVGEYTLQFKNEAGHGLIRGLTA
jgi:hypothetical protein